MDYKHCLTFLDQYAYKVTTLCDIHNSENSSFYKFTLFLNYYYRLSRSRRMYTIY